MTLENKELETFLKDEGVFEKYMRNLNDEMCLGYGVEHSEKLTHSFLWNKAPEGLSFWLNLNDKFNEQQESNMTLEKARQRLAELEERINPLRSAYADYTNAAIEINNLKIEIAEMEKVSMVDELKKVEKWANGIYYNIERGYIDCMSGTLNNAIRLYLIRIDGGHLTLPNITVEPCDIPVGLKEGSHYVYEWLSRIVNKLKFDSNDCHLFCGMRYLAYKLSEIINNS